jgi:glycosyltransferase involved in cell wall biosynthesis
MSSPRKIVLVGTAYPLRGGLAAFNERLIREYRKNGADASIYTFSLQYPSILFPGKTQFSTEPAPAELPIRIRVNSINPLNWIRTGLELRKMRPDLLIVKFWMPFMAPCFGTICRIARGNRHTKVVTILDNLIPHERRPGDGLLTRFWTGSIDGCVAMSRSVLKDYEAFTGRKSGIYCPHPLYDHFGEPVGREEALKRLQLDPGYRYVLFFGFIRDYKGLELLLEAFAAERLKRSDIRLIVAGEFYCDPEPYREIIRRNGLEEKVIMINDFIPDSRVADYFSAADLVVQPYKSATQSGVTQIAYHFNKPMIITNVGGLAEFVPHGKVGYVVEPDPGEISTAILRFYEEGREQEFSANAAIEKLKYSWSSMIEAINEALGNHDKPN